MTCKNCGSSFEGNYCCNCGQRVFTPPFTIQQILGSAIKSIFNIERGFLFTMKEIALNPGKVVSEYMGGKRVKYSNPFKYLLILVTVYTMCTISLELVEKELEATYKLHPRGDQTDIGTDPEKIRLEELVSQVTPFFLKYLSIFQIALIPLLSVFSYLFFKQAGYNFAENLIFNTFLFAQFALIGILVMPLHYSFPGSEITSVIHFSIWIVYYIWASVHFFRSGISSAVIKSGLIFLFGYMLWAILLISTIAAYVVILHVRSLFFH